MDTIEYQEQLYPIKSSRYWPIRLHDATVFPVSKQFMPQRFTGPPTYARSGYRPSDRGPRSRMGQSLAMDQMLIVLLISVCWLIFGL
jgi:cytochrome P450